MASAKYSSCSHILTTPLPPDMKPLDVVHDFIGSANMSPKEIEDFLGTEESHTAAEQGEGEEKEGRHLARRCIELLEKVKEHKTDPHAYDLSLIYEADLQQMHQMTQYIKCHIESGQIPDIMQRYRLMHCGYDPFKAKSGDGGGTF